MSRHAILMIAFFNCDLIEKTLKSLIMDFSPEDLPYDIYILENLSPKSELIGTMIQGYQKFITKHIQSDINNFASIIVDAFDEGLIPKTYKYYSITESDVILDPKAYHEAVYILKRFKFEVCSIDLSLNNLPLKKYPEARSWVPPHIVSDKFLIGNTGFQFVVFRGSFFLEYLQSLASNKKKAIKNGKRVQLIRDQLLEKYCGERNITWVKTKKHKLIHTGWDLYLDPENEYVKYKESENKDKDWAYTPGAKLKVIF